MPRTKLKIMNPSGTTIKLTKLEELEAIKNINKYDYFIVKTETDNPKILVTILNKFDETIHEFFACGWEHYGLIKKAKVAKKQGKGKGDYIYYKK